MAQLTAPIKKKNQSSHRRSVGLLIFLIGILILILLSQQLALFDQFSDQWNLGLRQPLNDFKTWIVQNRRDHWLFVLFFDPFSAVIDFGLRRAEDSLLWVPWPMILVAFFVIADRLGGLRLALLTVVCLLPMGLFGLWEESMETLALMVTAVLFSVALGIPVGIWSARNRRVEAILHPILDAMQTLPAFVYLIPVLLFFGIARVPSVIATMIYALPPIIRLTTLGIQTIPAEIIEAAAAFGTTEKQLLRKVQLPLALPSILIGVNQTIMMALSIVVIAALIGAGGLGDVVLKSLRRLAVGSALEAGLAIVLMAVLLDRLSAAMIQTQRQSHLKFQPYRLFAEKWRGQPLVDRIEAGIGRTYQRLDSVGKQMGRFVGRLLPQFSVNQRKYTAVFLLLLLLSLLLRLIGVHEFPRWLAVDISQPVDRLVEWMQVNLYDIGGTGVGTGPFRDFLIIHVFRPLQTLLADQLPWVLMVYLFAALAYFAGGWRLATAVAALATCVGLLGMWSFAMDTLAQTIIAVLICVGYGVPLGIWAAHNDRVANVIRPVLDFLQTIPIFVYLVPVIMLFGSGSVAGLIASVLYSAVPVIRLTNSGIRAVDKAILETAVCFGATPRQILRKVELPLALPSIMLGINQTIMMVLAMVIIAGLIGATGLGLEVYQGFANDNLGRSVEAGLAIVLLAIIIDRITQKLAQKSAQLANLLQVGGDG